MHELLRQQLRTHFGDDASVPPALSALLTEVDGAYREFDDARVGLEDTLRRNSQELLQANAEMRAILQELTRQRAFLRQVIDLTPHFIFAKDRRGRFTLVNQAVADAYGTSVPGLLGKTDADFNPHATEVEHFRGDDLEVLETGRDKLIPEEMITDARGNVRWLETIKRAIRSPEGDETQLLGVATDITERLRAEQKLRARTETVLAHQVALHELALMDNSDWSAAIRQICGTSARVLGVERVSVWLLEEGRQSLVCKGIHEGDRFEAEPGITVKAAEHPRYFQAIAESRTVAAPDARTDPRTSEFAEAYLLPLGIASLLDVPLRLQGALVGVVCHEHLGSPREWSPEEQHFAASIADFISLAMSAANRRRLEAELLRAQKMEAIGHLAGGVAHDFNNILTAILGTCELILSRTTVQDPNRSQVLLVKQAAERAALLTRQLLAFGRKQVLNPRVLDLNRVVAGMEPMLRRLIDEHIVLVTEFAPDLERVRADPGQIEQVLLNLVVNGRDAMPQGGTLVVRTANMELEAPQVRGHPGSAPGRYVLLTVADSGTGMDSGTLARIFEPFFTTKEPGRGTGLGLSTVYGIVRQSGGHLDVRSESGHGSVFGVYLPAVDAEPEEAPAVLPVAGKVEGSEVILLVEDELQVRTLVRRILEIHGYRVLEAALGREAIARSRGFEGQIHLLLTDVVMPGMNGRELYESLRKERPGMKVLYMSGYTETAFAGDVISDADFAFIQKPFDPGMLARRIREIIDAAARDDGPADSPSRA